MKFIFTISVILLQAVLAFSQGPPTVNLSASKSIIAEANGTTTITATLSASRNYPITVNLAVSGTATYNTDYSTSIAANIRAIIAGGNGSGANSNQFNNPYGIFVDAAGNLYVADRANHRIQKWAPSATLGTTVAGGNGQGSAANQLNSPTGVFVTTNGDIYIADSFNHRIQKWASGASSGTTVAGGNGEFYNPSAVFVDGNGDMYISDQNHFRIQKWTPSATNGTTVAGSSVPGNEAYSLDLPSDVFVDANGNIYICDSQNNRIQKWAPGASRGTTVAGGNGPGSATNQLNKPNGVFVDGNGNIYVADYLNHRIQKWANGAITGITIAGNGINQVGNPVRITGDSNGDIYFSELNNARVQKISLAAQPSIPLVIPAGSTFASVTIYSINDNLSEDPDETITLTPSSTNADVISTPPVTITINDKPLISLSAPIVEEEKSGVNLKVSLSRLYTNPVTVNLSTAGVAIKGTDYTLSAESVTIQPGDSVATVQIIPINDNIVEPLESIIIGVSSATNAFPLYPSVTTFLSSEDKPNVALTSNVTSFSEANGVAQITATLSEPTSREVIIDLSTAGTAFFKRDYAEPQKVSIVAEGGFSPSSIAMAADGTIFIGNYRDNRIEKLAPSATSSTIFLANLSPTDIFIIPNGDMYVADYSNHRILKIAAGTTTLTTVAGGLGAGAASNQLNYPTGIFVDNAGNIFIADQLNHRIQKWAPGATNGITVAGGNGQGNAANQLNLPTDVVLDINGDMYIADRNNDRIQKWASGEISGITVAGGNGRGNAANQLSLPYSILVDESGNVYIAEVDYLLRWAPGATSGVVVVSGKPADFLLGYRPRIIEDPNGYIYFTDEALNKIRRTRFFPSIVIPAGQTQGSTTIKGMDDTDVEPDESIILTAVSKNANTSSPLNLTLISNDAPPTIKLTPASSTIEEEKSAVNLKISLDRITYQTVTVNLSISGTAIKGTDYTLSAESVVIQPGDSVATIQITPINDNIIEVLESIIITVSSATNASTPYPDTTVYISSEDKPTVSISADKTIIKENEQVKIRAALSAPTSRETIVNLDLTGTALYNADYSGDFPTKEAQTMPGISLNQPKGIHTDANGNIFVADFWNSRVVKITPGATSVVVVAGGNGQGTGPNQLNFPSGVFVDANGNLFISDSGNNRIQKWAPGASTGTTVAGGLGAGANPFQLDYPEAVAVDASGNIYIADKNNHRIQKWAPGASTGTTVAGGNGPGNLNSQLNLPSGLLIDEQGNLYIIDANNYRIQKWAPGSSSGVTVAGGNGKGTAANQLFGPSGIYVDPNKSIYITDYNTSRLIMWVEGAAQGITIANMTNPRGLGFDNKNRLLITLDNSLITLPKHPQILIPAGLTQGEIALNSIEDNEAEPNETIKIKPTDADNAIVDTTSLNILLVSGFPPAQPEPFTASSAVVCQGQTGVVYTVPPVSNASSYIWTYSGTGATFSSTTNTVSIDFSNTATSGILSVKAQNILGTSPERTISITVGAPVQPIFSTSTKYVCKGQNTVVYTVAPVNGATSYTWAYSGTGATFSSTTNSVSINFSASATGGILSVTANNTCGSGTPATLNVSLYDNSVPENINLTAPLVINTQATYIARKSVTLLPVGQNSISVNQGSVFLAAIVSCPN